MAEVQIQRGGLLARIQTLDAIRLLTPRQFETMVADLMEQLGYIQVAVVGVNEVRYIPPASLRDIRLVSDRGIVAV